MNKKLLFFLSIIMSLCYASEYSNERLHKFLEYPFPCVMDIFTTQNQRDYQEDRVYYGNVLNKGWLFGVMDGHANAKAVDYVVRHLPFKFGQGLADSLTEKQSFERAFAEVEERVVKNFRSGSTALFVYIAHDRVAHVAYVGDSRAVFGNNNGVVCATQDHTFEREDERNRVIQTDGIIYRYKSMANEIVGPWRINGLGMSRSIGDAWSKGKCSGDKSIPAIRTMKMEDNNEIMAYLKQWPDTFLVNGLINNPQIGHVIADPEYTQLPLTDVHRWLILATDGLWNTVNNEEALMKVQDYYDEKKSLMGVAAFLCELAIKKGSEDNIAVFVIDLLHVSNENI